MGYFAYLADSQSLAFDGHQGTVTLVPLSTFGGHFPGRKGGFGLFVRFFGVFPGRKGGFGLFVRFFGVFSGWKGGFGCFVRDFGVFSGRNALEDVFVMLFFSLELIFVSLRT